MSDLRFPQVASAPYPWPFDGPWRARETALLLIGWRPAAIAALGAEDAAAVASDLAADVRAGGVAVVHVGTSHPTAWRDGDGFVGLAGGQAFFRTPLEAILRNRGVRNLIAAGLPTEGLLHASVRAANDMGFECLTVSDACKGSRADFHEAQLRITIFGNGLFGAVASAASLREALRAPMTENVE
jgi:nicotinamidase-related amidase